ncbi:hypothetical protein [Kitasatospora sp. NPDC092286]|uniref:hypothetical protein n=1 Tax=Kitasatospora sp. NPDC092286 TaxID=3364087 RepID=UPI00380BE368
METSALTRKDSTSWFPVMRLAERCGLARLVADKVKLTGAKNSAGAAADAKVASIVASAWNRHRPSERGHRRSCHGGPG